MLSGLPTLSIIFKKTLREKFIERFSKDNEILNPIKSDDDIERKAVCYGGL